MNTSSRFIIDTIKSWENKFPGIHVKYAFEENTCFHVIEVRPEEIHEGSEERVESIHREECFRQREELVQSS